ncbi:sulfite exporter TauE/SafE family protein [uncultured Sphaerochaeta sp.]|uniref:sulfite exporter TauE/SafE family protein n=1 Tax=uncultured Sphaerochaeta sp. TaxID=886478 RepID=UPI0029CA6938|nr:sulfite exporter TauE/SafE family protein [uncultured Sphaerochaeta sp.]
MLLLRVFAIVFVGAFLQSNIGFGFPIIAMIFFPSLFPFSTAVTLNQIIAIASTGFLTIRYWKSIQWKMLIPLLVSSLLVGAIVIVSSLQVESRILTGILGIFLMALSLYFACFSNKIVVQASLSNGLLMGIVAGLGNGLFGIGGPPVALYLFAAVKDKKHYLATIQAYFLVCNIQSIFIRSYHGAFELSYIPIILIGWVAIAVGTYIGLLLFKRTPDYLLKRIVYIFVGASGLWIALQQFILGS